VEVDMLWLFFIFIILLVAADYWIREMVKKEVSSQIDSLREELSNS